MDTCHKASNRVTDKFPTKSGMSLPPHRYTVLERNLERITKALDDCVSKRNRHVVVNINLGVCNR